MTFTLNTPFSKNFCGPGFGRLQLGCGFGNRRASHGLHQRYVTDSQCGAKHGKDGPDVACVKKCIEAGGKPVFVDDKTGTVWAIEDPDVVRGHYGHHIVATGTANTEGKSIHIDKVAML